MEALCKLFPAADIFTLFYEPERISPVIRSHRIHTSFLNPLRRMHRHTLPLAPFALEHFDLRSYDLIISSESGPAKGVIVSSSARHVCYCHSPMRYLWDLYPAYLHEWTHGRCRRALVALFSNYLRLWDYAAAARVDDYLANSANVQRRIKRAYRRDSDIVYPPVETERFFFEAADDYFLVVSALVEYKRVRDAVISFSKTGQPLKIVGEGPQYRELKSLAGPDIEFCGRVSDAELIQLYAHCRAVILPGEEDFGIVPVEALASGKPVIALGKGGVLESVPVRDPCGGFFYDIPGPDSLADAVREFQRHEARPNPLALQHAAQRFSTSRFMSEISWRLGLPATRPASAGALN